MTLLCHVNPDGGALLGSTLALHHVLLAAGVDSVASFPSPFVVAPHYRDLPGLNLLTPPELADHEPEVMVTFDCGDLARLGDLETNAKAARELIVIDHHASNERYGTINVIDVKAAASGVLVRRLIARLGLPLTRDAAVCLYAALVCDTGRFQYESTTPEVFELAAELACFDLPIATLSRTLFEEHRFAYLKLVADVLARAQLVPEKGFVWAKVTQADLHRHGVTFEEIEGLIDVVRRTREADVSCSCSRKPPTVRGGSACARSARSTSARSRGTRAAAATASPPASPATIRPTSSSSASSTSSDSRSRLGDRDPRDGLLSLHDGLVVVDKGAGMTSHDVVARMRKIFGQRRGRPAGTLDPGATGVLLVGLGRCGALVALSAGCGKAYRARVVFGVATDTLGASGAVLERASMTLTSEQVEQAARAFVGDIAQIPPMVSAIKIDGRTLYELARAGEVVERAARNVRIETLVVEEFVDGAYPEATIRIDCSSGTYVRSLAADLGTALGGCAHLGEAPQAASSGRSTSSEAHSLDVIANDPAAYLTTPAAALRDMTPVAVDDEARARSRTVRRLPRPRSSVTSTHRARSRCSTSAASWWPCTSGGAAA